MKEDTTKKHSPFEILGIPENSTFGQVKNAWHKFALTHHPDRNGDPEKFQTYLAAYKAAIKLILTPKPCESCNGTGRTWLHHGFTRVKVLCQACRGSGKKSM